MILIRVDLSLLPAEHLTTGLNPSFSFPQTNVAPIHLSLWAGSPLHDFGKVQAGKNKLACVQAFDFMNSVRWPRNAAILVKKAT